LAEFVVREGAALACWVFKHGFVVDAGKTLRRGQNILIGVLAEDIEKYSDNHTTFFAHGYFVKLPHIVVS